MFKTATVISVLFLQAVVEPFSADADLTRYAVTQGGLLIVVLVLLWSIRNDSKRKDERLEVMIDLVAASTAALTRSADTGERLARAVENLERRGSR